MLDILVEASQRCGEVLGDKYVLGDVIGVGGMGIVYSAVQRSLGRSVAVKVPRLDAPEMEMIDVRARFRTEAYVASRLWHRNIVSIIDYGEACGMPYLVMERMHGTLLGKLVSEQGTFEVAPALDLVGQVLDALAESHASGIVHADVKSDNVLVEERRDGTIARLFDFGLACACDRRGNGESGIIHGTPEYMAPELIRGKPASPAADVYAAGIMLYELLTGITPFGGVPSKDVLARHIGEDPVAPSRRLGGTISQELDAAVLRALQKAPDARYPDAGEFASALRAVCSVRREPPAPIIARPRGTRAFSTTGETVSWGADEAALLALRSDASRAVTNGSAEEIIVTYLALAGELMEHHKAEQAAVELEHAIALLKLGTGEGALTSRGWTLLVTLAALYDHLGDRVLARRIARIAHDEATRAHSVQGQQRAQALFARFIHGTCELPKFREHVRAPTGHAHGTNERLR